MDHNQFSFRTDIVDPIRDFMAKREISCDPIDSMPSSLTFCKIALYEDMAVVPEEYNREMLFRALHKKSSN
jgi:hypothetical protein